MAAGPYEQESGQIYVPIGCELFTVLKLILLGSSPQAALLGLGGTHITVGTAHDMNRVQFRASLSLPSFI